jgi:hypothetical protein
LSELRHVNPVWVFVSVAAEAVSLTAYALIVRRLLLLGIVAAPLRAVFGLTLAGIAIMNSLPGGQAISSINWFQQLRRYGAGRALAAIVLLAASVIGVITLIYLTVFGIAINGGHGFLGRFRAPLLIGAALFLIVRIAAHRQIVGAFHWLAPRGSPRLSTRPDRVDGSATSRRWWNRGGDRTRCRRDFVQNHQWGLVPIGWVVWAVSRGRTAPALPTRATLKDHLRRREAIRYRSSPFALLTSLIRPLQSPAKSGGRVQFRLPVDEEYGSLADMRALDAAAPVDRTTRA